MVDYLLDADWVLKRRSVSGTLTQTEILEIDNRGAWTALTTGTSTGSNTASTLKDTGKNFSTLGVQTNDSVIITGGTGSGQERRITSLTGTTQLNTSPDWITTPDSTSTYTVRKHSLSFQASGLTLRVDGGTDNQLAILGINDGLGDWAYIDVNGVLGTGIAIDPNYEAWQAIGYQSKLRGRAQHCAKFYTETGTGANSSFLSGTSTGGGTSTELRNTGANFSTSNVKPGMKAKLTGGTGSGQEGVIQSVTATILTMTTAWGTTPDATTTYEIWGVWDCTVLKLEELGGPGNRAAYFIGTTSQPLLIERASSVGIEFLVTGGSVKSLKYNGSNFLFDDSLDVEELLVVKKQASEGGQIDIETRESGGGTYWHLDVNGTGGGSRLRAFYEAETSAMELIRGDPASATTALYLKINNGATSLQQVTLGAVDSGGTGYKVLRVPN